MTVKMKEKIKKKTEAEHYNPFGGHTKRAKQIRN